TVFFGLMGWMSTETSCPSDKPDSLSSSMVLPWIMPFIAIVIKLFLSVPKRLEPIKLPYRFFHLDNDWREVGASNLIQGCLPPEWHNLPHFRHTQKTLDRGGKTRT